MGLFNAINAVRTRLAPKLASGGHKSTSTSSVARPGVKVSTQRPTPTRAATLKNGTVACSGQRPSVRRVGLQANDLLPTNERKPTAGAVLPGASKEQVKIASSLHRSFEEAAEGSEVTDDLTVNFQEQVSLAKQCNLFSIWPFPEEQEGHGSSPFDIPTLLEQARHNDRLAVFVPLLQRLFIALRSSRPPMTPHLRATIETMVKCKDDSFSPEEVRVDLINMLQPLQYVVVEAGTVEAGTNQGSNTCSDAAVSSDAIVSSQSSAAMQSAAEPPPEQSTPDHQQGEDETPSDDFLRADKTEDFGPHVFAAYKLVMDGPSTESVQDSLPHDQLLRQQSLLRGMRVHNSQLSKKAYTKRHTNIFRFDFNQRMSERRRRREAGWDADGRTLSVDEDTSEVLADVTCAAAGLCDSFQEHDVGSGLGVVDDEDPYLG